MPDSNKATVKIFGQQYTIAGTASSEEMEHIAEHVDSMMTRLSRDLPSLSTMSLAVLTAVNAASEYYEAMKENDEQKKEIAGMKKDTDRYSRLWEEAKSTLLKYQEETKNGVDQLKDLQRIYNTKNAELEKARNELEDLRSQYEESQRQLREAEGHMTELEEHGGSEELEEKLEQARKENAGLQSKVAELSEKLEAQTRDAGESEELFNQSEKEKEALKARAGELEKQVADLEKQLAAAGSGDGGDSQSLSEFREKYKELENSFFDIQMENITLKNELDEFKKQ